MTTTVPPDCKCGSRALDREEHALDVHSEDVVELIFPDLAERIAVANTGVGDDGVEPSMSLDNLGVHCFGL